MQKLGFPTMRSLDHLKSLTGSVSGTAKTFSFSSRQPTDSISSGSFTNLKITAEKLVKEQASVKTDLDMANNKLKKSMEHIRALEEKLQNAFNENAKLKVKQKEDEKLWNGLESKFSSTKALCDQLSETLKQLASQVHDAEKDKELFEGKLSANANVLDDLNQLMNGLSLKLDTAEETIKKREKEFEDLKIEKEEMDKFYRDEQCRTTNLIDEKDAMIKNFETTVAANRLTAESLNSKLSDVKLELKLKEDHINHLLTLRDNLEKEKSDVQLLKEDLAKRLDTSFLEIKNLEALIHVFSSLLVEVDKQSLTVLDKFDQLNYLYNSCFKLVQEERDLASKHALRQYDQLNDKFLLISSEKNALQLGNQDLNNKVIELQKVQESIMAQLSEEGNIARERIQNLESEAESLVSKKIESEKLISTLELQVETLSESSRSSENKLNQVLLATAESRLAEARKQYDVMLESKQLELSRHLKELSQRNDQAINDIQKKYEAEKLEIINMEKEKVENITGELEAKCDKTVAECKEESRQYLMRVQEEHASLVSRIQQDYDRKELSLKANHSEELKRSQLQAEGELKELEDECRKLQDELDLQKSREDQQRALLQLQWRVMGDKLQEDQEVNSKKDYSVSSIHIKNSAGAKRSQHTLVRPDNEEKDSSYLRATQTPVSKMLKKVENPTAGSVLSIPKHHKKVTHHEYEVETSNGRTITKRRKTKSTVMFEDPRKRKKMNTPKVNTPRNLIKGVKEGSHLPPPNLGDLFREGSLDPYADDPYAFD
uniref:Synaptonemal complex protein 1 n=1 Tax=Cannabis sativa TaxID=3483 RepID=A0A803NMB9_CANSA